MSLGSRAVGMEHEVGIGPNDAPVIEMAAESVSADGSEETLFDDGEDREYDLGEGD